MARSARARSADGATIAALFPPSSRMVRRKRGATCSATACPMRVEPVADTIRTCGPVQQHARLLGAADHDLIQVRGHIAHCIAGTLQQRVHGKRGERGLLGGFPQHGIAACQRERRVPRPHRDREVEGADHHRRPERVPGLHHAMPGALAGDGQAVQLARQPDGEIADVDHFLHFAQPFLQDLAGLDGHQPPERLLVRAHQLAEPAHQLTAPGRRHAAPRRGMRRSARAVFSAMVEAVSDLHAADP